MLLTLRQAGSVFGAAHWPDLQPELAPPACVGFSIVRSLGSGSSSFEQIRLRHWVLNVLILGIFDLLSKQSKAG